MISGEQGIRTGSGGGGCGGLLSQAPHCRLDFGCCCCGGLQPHAQAPLCRLDFGCGWGGLI